MTDAATLVADLRRAEADLQAARDAVDAVGIDRIDALADAVERLRSLLDSYEGRATGTGDFPAYVRFQEELATTIEELPDDLLERETFEEIEAMLDKRRLSETDFDRARDALAPAIEIAARRERRREALAEYREARRAVEVELRSTRERIGDLVRLVELGEADLDAPVEDLRGPIMEYNRAARNAWQTFRSEESARNVLDLVATTDAYPLVSFRSPPPDLRRYIETHDAGERPIGELLDLADYSTSKLSHVVGNPRELKRHVATNRTYLDRLDADPLLFAWPPESANSIRWRAKELIAVCGRFASDELVALLREIRDFTRDDAFDHLRNAIIARAELSADERERVASGAVEADLATARADRERLEEALAEFPER